MNYLFVYSTFKEDDVCIAIYPESKALDAFDFVKNHQLPKQYLFILKGDWAGFGEIPDSTNLNLQEVKHV